MKTNCGDYNNNNNKTSQFLQLFLLGLKTKPQSSISKSRMFQL